MEARQSLSMANRIVTPCGLPSPVGAVRLMCRYGGLGALSGNTLGNNTTPGSTITFLGHRTSHIVRTAQWSSARADPPPAPLGKRLRIKPESGDVPEAHKVFDEVVIVVKGGRGGNGEIVPAGRGRFVPNHKYKPGGNQAKQIWLPASDPGDGADGGDVVLVCDPGVDSLLHLHRGGAGLQGGSRGGPRAGGGGSAAAAGTFCGPDGSNANPNTGSGGPKRNQEIKKARTPALEIPVPPGTVVKRKGTGQLLGELLQPGQRLTVARGGPGGHGVVAPSRQQRQARLSRAEREAQSKGVELVEVEDDAWRADSRGQAGQQLSLTLLLRVVADVGLVGFPNAGKSSLLKALTRASPAIAPYPFTTLMPNLGVLSAGGGATTAVLADLPGLIEGAHKGRGLGRNFLRHLRRTRAVLHVVDTSAPDPATDYYAVREELRMYNPDYCARPHVVALNKVDLLQLQPPQQQHQGEEEQLQPQEEDAATRRVGQLVAAVREAARRQAAEHVEGSYEGPSPRGPLAVVPCSAATGEGLKELAAALQRAIGASYIAEPDILRSAPDTMAAARIGNGGDVAAAVSVAHTPPPPPSPSLRRSEPPPPPPGWDDGGDDLTTAVEHWSLTTNTARASTSSSLPSPPADAAAAAADDGGWGRTTAASALHDDAEEELSEGELERFTAHCRELGFMDEQGNFLTRGSEAAGSEGLDDGELEAASTGGAVRVHDVLDEQEQSFLDEHMQAGAAPGDGAADDDEWVELASLDEQTLAAVLEELARGGGDGDGDDSEEAPLLDLRRDFSWAPSHEVHDRDGKAAGVPQGDVTVAAAAAAAAAAASAGAAQAAAAATEGAVQGAVVGKDAGQQHRQQGGPVGVAGVEETAEEEEELVKMAPTDDPDAGLLRLSLEELLALEKDW